MNFPTAGRAHRQRRFRAVGRWRGIVACLLGCLALLPATASAGAATTVSLGRLVPKSAPTGGCASCTDLQLASSTGAGYEVPPGSWTLTSWSGEGGASGGLVALRVFRPTGVPGVFAIVATSAMESVGAEAVVSFPVAIEVRPGDLIGILTGASGSYPNLAAGSPGDKAGYVIGGPSTGQTVGPGTPYPYGETERYVNVAATLSANTAPLQVTRSGTGSGTVTSVPAGIECGAVCAASFDLGEISLVASPAPGSTFAGWSGGGCSGTGICALSFAAATTVDARFDAIPAPTPPAAGTAVPAPVAPSPTCRVPKLLGATPKAAKRRIRAARCGVGAITHAKTGGYLVVGQHPKAGKTLPVGSKVGFRVG